jgi:hypothetical protein
VFQKAVLSGLFGIDWDKHQAKKTGPKGLGEACGGEFVEACRKEFGNALEKKVCVDCKGGR